MRREEEDEARGLTEEMQRNLDEAQSRSYEVERKLDRVLWEYIETFENNWTPAAHHDEDVANDAEQGHKELESGQRLRRNGALRWNRLGGTSRPEQQDSGNRRKIQISGLWSRVLKGKMEGIMTLVAEWFSLEDMKALKRCLRADVRLGQRMAIQTLPVRSGRPGVERSIG